MTLIKSMIKKYGPNIYTIAADYNFGQITAQWVKKTAEENGGKIIGEEFIPLSVSQFSSTISKIQQAKPDVLVTLLVGVPQSSFYEQWSKSGIKGLPMATTVNMAQATSTSGSNRRPWRICMSRQPLWKSWRRRRRRLL